MENAAARIFATAVFFACVAAAADDPYSPTADGPAAIDGWELSWSEEFNAEGAKPDPANWGWELGKVRNNEWQTYTRRNAICSGGRLAIVARREANGEYTSSSIVTKGRRHFLYGKYIFRARIPANRGAWPCMWLMGKDCEWPSGGEIDVQELYWTDMDGMPGPTLLCNMCWNGSGGIWDAKWNTTRRTLASLGDPGWAAKYHTWTMDWDESAISIRCDGELLCEQKLADAINEGEWGENTRGKCPFRAPQYILLNLPFGGDAGGKFGVDTESLPWTMEVDYIRVYRRTGTADGLVDGRK